MSLSPRKSPRRAREIAATFPPSVCCWHCQGTGREEISEELNETRVALMQAGPATAAVLAANTGRRISLTHNRLSALRTLGLARRVSKSGKTWTWEAVAPGGEP